MSITPARSGKPLRFLLAEDSLVAVAELQKAHLPEADVALQAEAGVARLRPALLPTEIVVVLQPRLVVEAAEAVVAAVVAVELSRSSFRAERPCLATLHRMAPSSRLM